MGKNNHRKERRIKIVDPKKIDYTRVKMSCLAPNPLYTAMKRNIDSSEIKTEKKDIDRIR